MSDVTLYACVCPTAYRSQGVLRVRRPLAVSGHCHGCVSRGTRAADWAAGAAHAVRELTDWLTDCGGWVWMGRGCPWQHRGNWVSLCGLAATWWRLALRLSGALSVSQSLTHLL